MVSLLRRIVTNPDTLKKLRRFRRISRGFYSFLILAVFVVIAITAEWLVGGRALVVRYQGKLYVPVYGAIHTGRDFGLDYEYEVRYRDLKAAFDTAGEGNWVLLPPIPYGPNEDSYPGQTFRPRPPDFAIRHYLGTDQLNRDILARLIYGWRNSLIFAVGFVTLTYVVGITAGCLMGYFGGALDLTGQRLIEIWSLVPFLFVVIIIRSILPPPLVNVWTLLGIVVLFSWTSITYYMRSGTYREKAREYVAAAQVLGAGTARIIFRHVLPNVLSTLVTFIPFTVSAAITSLTALDFLGFGLPPPTPSWGELLKQGVGSATTAPWIVSSAVAMLSSMLVLVTFVGEAIREAFDPKRFTTYQ